MTLLNRQADVYIIAVTDSALEEVAKEIILPGKVVAHTAGGVSKDILKHSTSHYGVFYPLQSMRRETNHLPDTPVFFEASDRVAEQVLQKLADTISFQRPVAADGDQRLKLHVAAVFVNNFTNHLFALAENYCRQEGIDFRQMIPLIRETVQRLQSDSPAHTMTGPAIRHDQATIEKHLELLKSYPQLQHIYRVLTESIQATS
jgi:predicted short-subunit dehydrogenase-like oxidoreductase (DUF2520 family)